MQNFIELSTASIPWVIVVTEKNKRDVNSPSLPRGQYKLTRCWRMFALSECCSVCVWTQCILLFATNALNFFSLFKLFLLWLRNSVVILCATMAGQHWWESTLLATLLLRYPWNYVFAVMEKLWMNEWISKLNIAPIRQETLEALSLSPSAPSFSLPPLSLFVCLSISLYSIDAVSGVVSGLAVLVLKSLKVNPAECWSRP